jgi:hypothetical protein
LKNLQAHRIQAFLQVGQAKLFLKGKFPYFEIKIIPNATVKYATTISAAGNWECIFLWLNDKKICITRENGDSIISIFCEINQKLADIFEKNSGNIEKSMSMHSFFYSQLRVNLQSWA